MCVSRVNRPYFSSILTSRRIATCKPGKPGLTSFSETLTLFFIQFFSFWKAKVQGRQNGTSGLPEKLAGYVPDITLLKYHISIKKLHI